MTTLAVNTMRARAQRPCRQSSMTPETIVLLVLLPELSVLSTGRRFAGTSITAAANPNADAVDLLLNLKGEKMLFKVGLQIPVR